MEKNNFFLIVRSIFIGLIIASLIKIFVIEFLFVDGSSMEPAIKNGQTILINKLSYGLQNPFGSNLLIQWSKPKKNDIIVYLYKNNLVVKRCVGIENTRLDYLQDSKYYLLVDLKEKIPLTDEQYTNLKKCFNIPKDYILAVGDNHESSYDSRNYGFIPVSNVLGKVICK